MRNIFFLLLTFLAATPASFAQKKRDRAEANIMMLKEGALFVRLRTSELQINALKSAGKKEEAEKLAASQDATNKMIMAAFKKNFTFCKVYFFYSNNSADITSGNCKGKIFDADMNLFMNAPCDKFLVGEFDKSETNGIDAFVIKDKNYEQLHAPFPYLVRLNQAFVTTRSDEEIVKVLNERLYEFYNK
ncbi:MAG: hypothetical protein ACJ77K_03435 [Bacteroidia bacterium]|jgi:hypothetical protein